MAKQDIFTPLPSGNSVILTDSASHPTNDNLVTMAVANGEVADRWDHATVVEITPTTSVHWTHGAAPVATAAHPVIPAGLTRQVCVDKQHKLAFIKQTNAPDGFVMVHPCKNRI